MERSAHLEPQTFLHSGSQGDVIYSLPAIVALGGGVLYLRRRFFANLEPLLAKQPYLPRVEVYSDQACDHVLDRFRHFARDRRKLLTRCHLEAVGAKFDLAQCWIQNVAACPIADIVVACTPRYHSAQCRHPHLVKSTEFPWSILAPYRRQMAFIDFDAGWQYVRPKIGGAFVRYKAKNAFEMAAAIKGSKLFIGNQSLAFAIAEGLKHPRVLEVCSWSPNCMPQSANGHTELTVDVIEQYLN